jgi:hypothetical protein
VSQISSNTRWGITFVSLMISLILEENEFVCFIIGTIVCEVGHINKIIMAWQSLGFNLSNYE